MKSKGIILITIVAMLAFTLAAYADTQPPAKAAGKTTVGDGNAYGGGTCDGTGAQMGGKGQGQGQGGSGNGDRIRKRDGSSGGNPTQTRQGQKGQGKGRGRGGN